VEGKLSGEEMLAKSGWVSIGRSSLKIIIEKSIISCYFGINKGSKNLVNFYI